MRKRRARLSVVKHQRKDRVSACSFYEKFLDLYQGGGIMYMLSLHQCHIASKLSLPYLSTKHRQVQLWIHAEISPEK